MILLTKPGLKQLRIEDSRLLITTLQSPINIFNNTTSQLYITALSMFDNKSGMDMLCGVNIQFNEALY